MAVASRKSASPKKKAPATPGKSSLSTSRKDASKTSAIKPPRSKVAPAKAAPVKAGNLKVGAAKSAPPKFGTAKFSHPKVDTGIAAAMTLVDAVAVRPLTLFRDTAEMMEDGLRPLPADEVFDEADGAQHLQLMEIADVQRRARLLNQPEVHPDFDGKHCVECDREIPPERLKLQRVRCVDCQQDLEAQARRQRQNTGR